MALALKLESLDAVGEALRGYYVEKDGGYVLDVEGVEDTAALKKALTSERETRKKLEGDLKRFAGVDPAKYQDALDKLELLESGAPDKDKLREQNEAYHRRKVEPTLKELAEAKAALERIRSERDRHVLGSAIRDAVGKLGDVQPTAIADILNRGMSAFEVDDAGKVVGKGDFSGFELSDWAESLKKDAPHFFQMQRPSGSGAPGNTGGGNGSPLAFKRDQLRDVRAYRAAKEQAAKAGVEIQLVD